MLTTIMKKNRIKKIKMLENQISALKEQVELTKNELKMDMIENNLTEEVIGNHTMRYTEVTTNRVDNDKLKKDGLYYKYLKENKTMRFRID